MRGDGRSLELTLLFRGMGVHPDWPERLKQAQRQTTVSIGGVSVARIRYGDEGPGWQVAERPCGEAAAAAAAQRFPIDSCYHLSTQWALSGIQRRCAAQPSTQPSGGVRLFQTCS
jgi:hypothetical protein